MLDNIKGWTCWVKWAFYLYSLEVDGAFRVVFTTDKTTLQLSFQLTASFQRSANDLHLQATSPFNNKIFDIPAKGVTALKENL